MPVRLALRRRRGSTDSVFDLNFLRQDVADQLVAAERREAKRLNDGVDARQHVDVGQQVAAFPFRKRAGGSAPPACLPLVDGDRRRPDFAPEDVVMADPESAGHVDRNRARPPDPVGERVVASECAQFEIDVLHGERGHEKPGVLGSCEGQPEKSWVEMGAIGRVELDPRLAEHDRSGPDQPFRSRPIARRRVEEDVEVADPDHPAGEVRVGKLEGVAKPQAAREGAGLELGMRRDVVRGRQTFNAEAVDGVDVGVREMRRSYNRKLCL